MYIDTVKLKLSLVGYIEISTVNSKHKLLVI